MSENTDLRRKLLIEAAQDALRDDRHWTLVEVADRAESGPGLARAILEFLDVEQEDCPEGCEECQEHEQNLG